MSRANPGAWGGRRAPHDRSGDRVLVLLSSGGLAATQTVINLLRQRSAAEPPHMWSVGSMFDVANLVSDAMRDIERREAPFLETGGLKFNASFILGGQIAGEAMRLFRIYAEGNFIEASDRTPYLQTGETKYGKLVIDRVITSSTTLPDAVKCVLVSFDSTMRSNLSVGMPIDLICYERDSFEIKGGKAEAQMLKNMRHIDGKYESDMLAAIRDAEAPEYFMMLTDAKCRAAEAWVKEVVYQPGYKPWDLEPTPEPDLPPEVLAAIRQQFVSRMFFRPWPPPSPRITRSSTPLPCLPVSGSSSRHLTSRSGNLPPRNQRSGPRRLRSKSGKPLT